MAQYETATTAEGTSSSVSPSKPTGLAVGDLLLCYIRGRRASNFPSLNTPSGWTALTNLQVTTGGADRLEVSAYWKIADSSDVAASTFTFTCANTSAALAAVLSRWSNPDATPIAGSATAYTAGPTSSVAGGAVTPTMASKIAMFAGSNQTVTGHSAYAIVNNNPTWTEFADVTYTQSSVAGAWGGYPFTTTTGNGSYTSDAPDSYQNIYLVAVSSNPAAIQPGFVTLSSSLGTVTLPSIASLAATIVVTAISPVVLALTATWRNTSKNVSSWINRNKTP